MRWRSGRRTSTATCSRRPRSCRWARETEQRRNATATTVRQLISVSGHARGCSGPPAFLLFSLTLLSRLTGPLCSRDHPLFVPPANVFAGVPPASALEGSHSVCKFTVFPCPLPPRPNHIGGGGREARRQPWGECSPGVACKARRVSLATAFAPPGSRAREKALAAVPVMQRHSPLCTRLQALQACKPTALEARGRHHACTLRRCFAAAH